MDDNTHMNRNIDDDLDPGAGSSHDLSRTGHQVTLPEIVLEADRLPVGSRSCSWIGNTIPSGNEGCCNIDFPTGMDTIINSYELDPPGNVAVVPEVSVGRKRQIENVSKRFLIETFFFLREKIADSATDSTSTFTT